ncbi:N-sulfoglucosamine sulfohydrolase-like [Ciona intestinalis]
MLEKSLLVISTLFCVCSLSSGSDSRPNVLVLVADDLGFELNPYGNNVIKTPNINDLANRGIVYSNAYTTVSSCSPSRSTILTGLPQHQNGMYGLHNGYHHFNSFDGVKSLPFLLHENGIRTGIIGKKHVAPEAVYPFDFAETEENNSILQVGRNITRMKELAKQFFSMQSKNESFLLYIGFHDPHRCGHTHPQYGEFCEKFGNGDSGMGKIPDWKPDYYSPDDVIVPQFVQDTPASRKDISAQYTTISRLDQGVGLIINELKQAEFLESTLILFTSDNGIPFPNGRTNLYNSGTAEPFILALPVQKHKQAVVDNAYVSLLDITPTVLDWFSITYPQYTLFHRDVKLTGKSLLRDISNSDVAFGSHSLHEVTMYYPMRSVHKDGLLLIQNLNYLMPFPIDQDFYLSLSFQDILNRTQTGADLHWSKTLKEYYQRPQLELFNLTSDPLEIDNLAYKPEYHNILTDMQTLLQQWQNTTWDPWRCAPGGVLQDSGAYKLNPTCLPLLNGL